MPQLDLSAQDVMLMELLPVPARPIPPGGEGAFVDPKGHDDGSSASSFPITCL